MPRYFVAVCLGPKSKLNPDKLKAEFKRFLPQDELTIFPAPAAKELTVELIADLTQKALEAQICAAVQGLDEEEGEDIIMYHAGLNHMQYSLISWGTPNLERELVSIIAVDIEDKPIRH